MKRILKCLLSYVGLALLSQSTTVTDAAELALKVVKKDPPQEVDASIRKTLQSSAIQLVDGEKPVFEFWLSAEIPLPSKPESAAKGLDAIKQSTVLGAVAVRTAQRDYKDNELPAGIYTMRFGLQPQDGNHLGSAEFPYFAVLVQTKNDPALDSITDYKSLVKASSKGTATDHPMILSLRPASSTEGDGPKLSETAPEHKSLRLKVPARVSGGSDGLGVVFELVYRGKGKI